MPSYARRSVSQLCLLAATILPWAAAPALAADIVLDDDVWSVDWGCGDKVTYQRIDNWDTLPKYTYTNPSVRTFSTTVKVVQGDSMHVAALQAGDSETGPAHHVWGSMAIFAPDGRRLNCAQSNKQTGRLDMGMTNMPMSGDYRIVMVTPDTANNYVLSAKSSPPVGVSDCGVHRTSPVTNADGSLSYPGEHIFPASLPLQKGDNLGFLAVRTGDNADNPTMPVNGWAYIYRPDGHLLACVRNDAMGRLVMSIRGVPDTGVYHMRLVTPDNTGYRVQATKWVDAQVTLPSNQGYLFSNFYPGQSLTFTVTVSKAPSDLTVAFSDHNTSNALLFLTGPNGKVSSVDMGNTGYKFSEIDAGQYTVKVIPKVGTRLTGGITSIVSYPVTKDTASK